MSILEDLYQGNIRPSEKYILNGSEYQKINTELTNNIESLLKSLSKNEKSLFERINNDYIKTMDISQKEYFFEGFYLGANLIIELINYKSENFENL